MHVTSVMLWYETMSFGRFSHVKHQIRQSIVYTNWSCTGLNKPYNTTLFSFVLECEKTQTLHSHKNYKTIIEIIIDDGSTLFPFWGLSFFTVTVRHHGHRCLLDRLLICHFDTLLSNKQTHKWHNCAAWEQRELVVQAAVCKKDRATATYTR